jgi:thioesterase domain-containing protein
LPDPSPVVLLKAGSGWPPIFLAHGLGGELGEFSKLVSYIRSEHPIYGLKAKGTDGVETPLGRIEDMALYYLGSIETLQPHGPFFLVGYSLGGLVALEMAQRLSAKGEKIALLAMLDSYPHTHYMSRWQVARLLAHRTAWHAATAARLPLPQALSYIFHPSSRSNIAFKGDGGSSHAGAQDDVALSLATQQRRNSDYLALTRYRPCFYAGKVKFVKAETASEFPTNPVAVWSSLIEKLEVETTRGDHREILTKNFENLANVLSRYLREADNML